MTTLAGRIQSARKRNNWSRAELARRIGVKPSAAVQWEQVGGTAPSTGNLIKLAQSTNVSLDWLATGRGALHSEANGDIGAINLGLFAQNTFEERLLELSRIMPLNAQEPLLRFIGALLSVSVRAVEPRRKTRIKM